MQLPFDLLSNTYTKPNIFLCEASKEKICQLETTNTSGSFKFNAYSELSFEVPRLYNDLITGENRVNPYYDKIEALRLIYLEGFGYFEIQTPELSSDGIKEFKTVTAYSSEYALAQKYLEKFYVNTGEIDSKEVLYLTEQNLAANSDTVTPITFYNPANKDLSLLDIVFEGVYGWDIGHVDDSLKTLSRTFEIDRQSVYDFLMNEVCTQFNCYIVFDTIENQVNFYAEALTQKFMGDGNANTFTLSPAFEILGAVSVGGYKTTQYTYNSTTGVIQFVTAPGNGLIVEIIDGALSRWETDVFITFDNLSQEIGITYDADEIKTKLTVKGADGLDIREVNMGQPYIIDLSYYCTPDWLGQDLYDAYLNYLKDYNEKSGSYTENAAKITEYNNKILYEQIRTCSSATNSIIVPEVVAVTPTTIGKYFIREGTAPNYYYTEVQLPDKYNASQVYYRFTDSSINLTEAKVRSLYEALQAYFLDYFKGTANINAKLESGSSLSELSSSFSFVENNLYTTMLNNLKSVSVFKTPSDIGSINDSGFIFKSVNVFLDYMWNEVGLSPLTYCYNSVYTNLQTAASEAGWAEDTSTNYGRYFAVYLIVKSIERAMEIRKRAISSYESVMKGYQDQNAATASGLDLYNYFSSRYGATKSKQFMMRLSAFLREDEYTDDNFVYTGQETADQLEQLKKELKECGKIELSKLCQPRLQFSMSMANIYALPEFEPIIDQFQLGRVIKVALRSDYIKQSRLLQVDINFDDFSDFSCEFGDLTNLKTQSDLHADLLAQAVSAGKSVASNKSYWNKGSDKVNYIDQRIQRGLLDAVTSIKSMDGTQGVEIDNYGIHLRKVNPETQVVDPEEGWITNNKFLYSNDNFQTVQSVYGKYTIDDVDYFGVLAKAVIAGYIEGSKIRGGTIQIGDLGNDLWLFEVDDDGNVSMCGGQVVFKYDKAKDEYINSIKIEADRIDGIIEGINGQIYYLINGVDDINAKKMHRVEISTEDSQIIKDKEQTAKLTCRIFSWDDEVTDQVLGEDYGDAYKDTTYVSLIRWKRKSNKPTGKGGDEEWNADENHQGKKEITITSEDIDHNASFYCEVELPDRASSTK